MHVRSRNTIAAALVFLAALSTASFVSAQVQQGIEIKPAIIENRVDPGKSYDFSVTITNKSDQEKTYFLNTEDIKGLNDAGLPIFSEENEKTPYELSQWITLAQSSLTLGPNESKTVTFSVHVPADASPGAHFGGVFFDDTPPKLRTTGSAVGMKVGPIINLRISGQAKEEAQIREFSTGNIVYGTPNVKFDIKVANLGNVLVRPRGLIEITDMRGAKIDVVNVNDSAAGVFPGGDKMFAANWNYDGFTMGRYSAVLSLVYGEDEQKTITAVTSFWVLPMKPILVILGSIFGAILLLYLFIRSYISRKLREMGGSRSDLYARRNQSPVPRLLLIALILLFFAIAFLVLLFVLFA